MFSMKAFSLFMVLFFVHVCSIKGRHLEQIDEQTKRLSKLAFMLSEAVDENTLGLMRSWKRSNGYLPRGGKRGETSMKSVDEAEDSLKKRTLVNRLYESSLPRDEKPDANSETFGEKRSFYEAHMGLPRGGKRDLLRGGKRHLPRGEKREYGNSGQSKIELPNAGKRKPELRRAVKRIMLTRYLGSHENGVERSDKAHLWQQRDISSNSPRSGHRENIKKTMGDLSGNMYDEIELKEDHLHEEEEKRHLPRGRKRDLPRGGKRSLCLDRLRQANVGYLPRGGR